MSLRNEPAGFDAEWISVDFKGDFSATTLSLGIYSHVNNTKHHLNYAFVTVASQDKEAGHVD